MNALSKKWNERDSKVDILRCIALICIIIAHSQPSNLLAQLRNFDVVLMVLLIGTSYYMSSAKRPILYWEYIVKRFMRLIVPTWIFISIFFICFYFISVLKHDNYYFQLNQIIGSYTIMNEISSIGFIWIMRVFFIIALICPLILNFSNKIKSDIQYYLYVIIYYIIYMLLISIGEKLHGLAALIYLNIITYGVGYGFIAVIGVRLPTMSQKGIKYLCSLFLFLSVILMYFHNFSYTQQFKFPPTLYYISYGVFVSLLLYIILDNKSIKKIFDNSFVSFVSIHSAWIYFWHIIFCYVIILFGEEIPFINNSFISRFLFLLSSALLVTYVHELVKEKIKNKSISTN